jgi:hypothetical protein
LISGSLSVFSAWARILSRLSSNPWRAPIAAYQWIIHPMSCAHSPFIALFDGIAASRSVDASGAPGRKLDFIIGDRALSSPAGEIPGVNQIEKALSGRARLERRHDSGRGECAGPFAFRQQGRRWKHGGITMRGITNLWVSAEAS